MVCAARMNRNRPTRQRIYLVRSSFTLHPKQNGGEHPRRRWTRVLRPARFPCLYYTILLRKCNTFYRKKYFILLTGFPPDNSICTDKGFNTRISYLEDIFFRCFKYRAVHWRRFPLGMYLRSVRKWFWCPSFFVPPYVLFHQSLIP